VVDDVNNVKQYGVVQAVGLPFMQKQQPRNISFILVTNRTAQNQSKIDCGVWRSFHRCVI
jgi:hypothetical protein